MFLQLFFCHSCVWVTTILIPASGLWHLILGVSRSRLIPASALWHLTLKVTRLLPALGLGHLTL